MSLKEKDSPQIAELAWRNDVTAGADICLLSGSGDRVTPERLVRLSWPAAIRDGWRRHAWEPIWKGDVWQRILIVAAPDVSIELLYLEKSFAEPGQKQDVQIIRVQRADLVPQDGEPIRYGMLLGSDLPVAAVSRTLEFREELTNTSELGSAYHARIKWLPDGAVFVHDGGDWEVRLQVSRFAPAAFWINVREDPMAYAQLAGSSFEAKIVKSGEVTVTANQKYTGLPIKPPFPLPLSLIGLNVKQFSIVTASVSTIDIPVPVPAAGLDPTMGTNNTPLASEKKYPEYELVVTQAGSVVRALGPTALEMLPYVGPFFELGFLIYAAATGYDVSGDKVTERDLLIMGIFCAIGFLPFMPSGLARTYKTTAGKLFPAVDLVSLNPGLKEKVAQFVALHISPLLDDGLRAVSEKDALRMVTKIDEVLAGTAQLAELVKLAGKTVFPAIENIETIGNVPVPLFRAAMKIVHIQDIDAFAKLPHDEMKTVLEAFAEAIEEGSDVVLKDRLPPAVWAEYLERVQETVIGTVFSPDLKGFRGNALETALFRDGLAQGFDLYLKRKEAAGETARIAIDWAYKQGPNSRYYLLLVAEFGPNFKELLKPLVFKFRYEVSKKAASFFKRRMPNPIDSYKDMQKMVGRAGLGHLFEADHILEKRFLDRFDIALDQRNFHAILVPKNPIVARGLEQSGVIGFLYVHSVKTARLRHFLPYKRLHHFFSAQAIYNVYRLVYIYEFKMTVQMFESFTDDIFELAAKADGTTLKKLKEKSPQTAEKLLVSVTRALSRVTP